MPTKKYISVSLDTPLEKLQDGGAIDIDLPKLKEGLIKSEHGGYLNKEGYNPYTSMNSDGAMGKYQFLESVWGSEIRSYAKENGYRYRGSEDFLNNSALQEDFFEHYMETQIIPQAKKIKEEYNTGEYMSDYQLVSLLHFTGYPKTRNIIQTRDFNSPQSHQTTANDYLETSGFGRVGSDVRHQRNQRGNRPTAAQVSEAGMKLHRNEPNPPLMVINQPPPRVEKNDDPLGLKSALMSKIVGNLGNSPYEKPKGEVLKEDKHHQYIVKQLRDLNQL